MKPTEIQARPLVIEIESERVTTGMCMIRLFYVLHNLLDLIVT